jgi:hypothetical protein
MSYLVTDHPFNREWNKEIIGLKFTIPPSYTAVKLVDEPADYYNWEEYGRKLAANPR